MSRSVLIIDDDEEDHFIMKEMLADVGIGNVYSILDGSLALGFLEQLKANLPSMIILDYNMPKMDGLEVLQKIKEKYDIPILLYTTTPTDEVAKMAKEKGALDCIKKAANSAENKKMGKLIVHLLNTR